MDITDIPNARLDNDAPIAAIQSSRLSFSPTPCACPAVKLVTQLAVPANNATNPIAANIVSAITAFFSPFRSIVLASGFINFCFR